MPYIGKAVRMLSRAVTRRPGEDFRMGITTSALGPPDTEKASFQHEAYRSALSGLGLEVTVLEPEPGFPDSTFVEDTAVVTEKVAVITRPGDPRRLGEEVSISAVLARYRDIEQIVPPGTVDGGDVMRAGDHFFIGRSARTNAEGADRLGTILTRYGYTYSKVMVGDMLHLKSGVNSIGGGRLVVTRRMDMLDEFSGFERIVVPEGEEYAANCLMVNGTLLIPSGFPRTRGMLEAAGYEPVELDMSEFMKMDGGLTCLSLRF